MPYPLLQASNLPQGRILVLSLVMVVALLAAIPVVLYLKRWLQKEDEPVSAGFTLSDLRQMHKSGQMTDAEFERAKAQIVDAARRASERMAAARAASTGDAAHKRSGPLE